ncbi:MAG: crotonase/enoyl-CoA hydratase family protein [Acidimicrobiia bacterium]|nr:crotonase/enoyl-CoA hydratase family protein [Acidimicrobiia bacterium]
MASVASVTVHYESLDRVGVIRLDRPEARNAINGEMATAIESAIDSLEADDSVWTGILCANGPAFCAGADLKAIAAGGANLATERGGFAGLVDRNREKPLIAAVEGPAVAGGTEIVLACDLIVASATAHFGIPEVKRSLIAAAGGLFRLPQVLPPKVAMELALTGGDLSAGEAHRHGMVNRLTEPGKAFEVALQMAAEINANAPLAVRASRRSILATRHLSDPEANAVVMEESQGVWRTEDFAEGPIAFVEKRTPVWKGR